MNLKLIRNNFTNEYTEGKLYLNGVYFCDILENPDRGLDSNMSLDVISKLKVYGKTCIPYGEYKVAITMSTKFKKLMPLIYPIKCFYGVRIHPGHTVKDTKGCLLVGKKLNDGTLTNSQEIFDELFNKLDKINTLIIE